MPSLLPYGKAALKLLESKQVNASITLHRRPHLWGVVPPASQKEANVCEIRVHRDMSQGLKPIFDEP